MDAALCVRVEARRAEAVAATGRGIGPPVVHCCGDCGCRHYFEAGTLRPLTPAEEFRLQVEVPRAVAAAESLTGTGGWVLGTV